MVITPDGSLITGIAGTGGDNITKVGATTRAGDGVRGIGIRGIVIVERPDKGDGGSTSAEPGRGVVDGDKCERERREDWWMP